MAILRSADGKFYDVPDDELANYEVPAEQVKGLLSASAQGPGPGPGPGFGPGPGMGPRGGGQVQPYGYCPPWRNCFRNCFRNCSGFRNCTGHQ